MQTGVFKSEDFDADPVATRAEDICRKNEADGTDPIEVRLGLKEHNEQG
jgi:hypothetical protein